MIAGRVQLSVIFNEGNETFCAPACGHLEFFPRGNLALILTDSNSIS